MTDTIHPTVPIDDTPATRWPDLLHVCRDTTPGAHETGSDEIFWWLPVLGPTASVLAHTLGRTTSLAGSTWDTGDLALRIGLAGNRPKLWQSLNRLDRFGVARFHATDVLTVRLWLPALTDGQLERLPADMAATYRNTRRHAS
ncbi:MAG TPA: hypothetical protein VNQ73_08795 [Ilumatobacter sp.]|nr:hypothetical protein [Ilumatobacter sp.]